MFNRQRNTYSSSVMYRFSSFSGSPEDIILRKRISLKQPERHHEGDRSELNFCAISNRKKKNKSLLLDKYMWANGNLSSL